MARSSLGLIEAFVIAGLLSAVLASCTTPTVTACPPIVAYSPETMAKAADEMAALPDGSALAAMMGDYRRERAELRACASPSQ